MKLIDLLKSENWEDRLLALNMDYQGCLDLMPSYTEQQNSSFEKILHNESPYGLMKGVFIINNNMFYITTYCIGLLRPYYYSRTYEVLFTDNSIT